MKKQRITLILILLLTSFISKKSYNKLNLNKIYLQFGDSVNFLLNQNLKKMIEDDSFDRIKSNSYYSLNLFQTDKYYLVYLIDHDSSNYCKDSLLINSPYWYKLNSKMELPVLTEIYRLFNATLGEINSESIVVNLFHGNPIKFDKKGKIIRK